MSDLRRSDIAACDAVLAEACEIMGEYVKGIDEWHAAVQDVIGPVEHKWPAIDRARAFLAAHDKRGRG